MSISQWRFTPKNVAIPFTPSLNRIFRSASRRTPHPTSHQASSTSHAITLTVLTQFFPPDYAATGQLIEELARHLGPHRICVNVFTGQPGYAFQNASAPTRERMDHVSIRRSHSARLWPRRIRGKAINGVLFCLRAALHVIKNRQAGEVLMVTTAPPFLPIVGYLAHLLFGTAYICVLYDLYPDIANEVGVLKSNHWLSRVWTWLNVRIWQNAESVIVLSSTMRNRVIQKCPAIAPNVRVIHNWSNPDWIVPIEKHENWFAWKHGLVEKFTVLYSGNLGRCHDVETLLATAKYLQGEPIQFLVIGSGAKNQVLMEYVRSLGLDNVRFLPYQDKEDLPYSLTACDLALVSVDAGMEGLVAPSKLYSALASGRPIAAICEQGSYLRDIIKDASCGGAVENGDAVGLAEFIRVLSCDRSLASQMGRAGRAYLQAHFTPEHIARQYASVMYKATRRSDSTIRAYHKIAPIKRAATLNSSERS